MKLMIVDDNDQMRLMIRHLFCDDVEEILECSGGEDAINTYNIEHPDYVLMDIEMKGIDGLAATKIIIQQNPEAKVIIITQHNTKIFRDSAIHAGAIGFVAKENLYKAKEFFNK